MTSRGTSWFLKAILEPRSTIGFRKVRVFRVFLIVPFVLFFLIVRVVVEVLIVRGFLVCSFVLDLKRQKKEGIFSPLFSFRLSQLSLER
jgi:hypothetical protein